MGYREDCRSTMDAYNLCVVVQQTRSTVTQALTQNAFVSAEVQRTEMTGNMFVHQVFCTTFTRNKALTSYTTKDVAHQVFIYDKSPHLSREPSTAKASTPFSSSNTTSSSKSWGYAPYAVTCYAAAALRTTTTTYETDTAPTVTANATDTSTTIPPN